MPPISANISQIGCVEQRRAPSVTLLGSRANDNKAASVLVQKDEEHEGTRRMKGWGGWRDEEHEGTRSLPFAVPQGLMLASWHRLLAWPLPKQHIICFSRRLGRLNFILWFTARDMQGLSLSRFTRAACLLGNYYSRVRPAWSLQSRVIFFFDSELQVGSSECSGFVSGAH